MKKIIIAAYAVFLSFVPPAYAEQQRGQAQQKQGTARKQPPESEHAKCMKINSARYCAYLQGR